MQTFYSLKDIETFCQNSSTGQYPLIIDTVVLIPFLMGLYDKEYLSECSLTASSYSIEDYDLILKITKFFRPEIIITPNIITELYNKTENKMYGQKLHDFFLVVIESIKNYKEHHADIKKLLGINFNFELFLRFGFADMSIIDAAKEMRAVILTDDRPLHDEFYKYIPIIKFSNIKNEPLQNLLS